MLCVVCKKAEARQGSATRVAEAGRGVMIITGLRSRKCEACEDASQGTRETPPIVDASSFARHEVEVLVKRCAAIAWSIAAWLSL
jgi:hypothetical protein